MYTSIVREGCHGPETQGGRGIVAVEAIGDAWLLLSLAVGCSAHSACSAC